MALQPFTCRPDPPILTQADLDDNARGALTLVVSALVRAHAEDNALKSALGGVHPLLNRKCPWTLETLDHLVIQVTQKETVRCSTRGCQSEKCADTLWCIHRALLLVLKSYLQLVGITKDMVVERQAAQQVEAEMSKKWALVDSGEADSIFAVLGPSPIDAVLRNTSPRAVAGRNHRRAARENQR
jgi:hypothetical protein